MDLDSTLKKTVSIKVKRLDINQSYFFGTAEINGVQYKINVQGHGQKKLLKLPKELIKDEKALLRLSGINDANFEDIVHYDGTSEWIEIDSDNILYYLADHQDQIDTIDVLSRF